MNDQRKGMKKCPEEIKRQIFKLAGPFTKYLNGRMELSSEFNKRLIRREAILMQWKGDYSELFSFAGDYDYFHKPVADIVINRSKQFHEWLVEHLESNNQLLEHYDRLQNLNWKEWWQDSISSSDDKQLRNDFETAIEYCHVEMVQFIMTNEELRKKVLNDEDDRYFVGRFIENCHWRKSRPEDVFAKSAESKMLWTILQNVTLNGSNRAMDAAAMIGDIEIVKWVHENIQDCCTTRTMNWAAQEGHLEIVKWLHENRTEGCTTWAMNNAARYGHLEIIKWLHENRTEGCTIVAMDCSAQYGHLEVVKWLHENRTEGCTTRAMDYAAANGHLEVLKWLHENRTEGCTTGAMNNAASYGHLEIVKWLHEHCPALCNLQSALEYAKLGNQQDIIQFISETIASRQFSNDQL